MEKDKAIFRSDLDDTTSIAVLICSGCRGILKYSNTFTEEEWKGFNEEIDLPPQTCNTAKVECKRFDGQR